ncbi:hypothetical protein [Aquisalimonas sp.]|uniref:hypothetical protein n=1 Tax=Aquisalimonas sp. TaxID=1872621 RepID=UPI0025BFFC0B|nr:hypothetical protein [Aquisalimonas sp.]
MQFSVRVLGLHEGGEWCALALDMSLRGYLESNDEPADVDAEYSAGDSPLPRAHHDGFEAVSA